MKVHFKGSIGENIICKIFLRGTSCNTNSYSSTSLSSDIWISQRFKHKEIRYRIGFCSARSSLQIYRLRIWLRCCRSSPFVQSRITKNRSRNLSGKLLCIRELLARSGFSCPTKIHSYSTKSFRTLPSGRQRFSLSHNFPSSILAS